MRCLESRGYSNLVTRTHSALDLQNHHEVLDFFASEKPEYVFLAAGKVGGIHANNTYRADFILHNLKIEANVIEAAHRAGVKGLLFLGSSCIYPKFAPQPLKEEYLLSGTLEPTNQAYAVAKIAGIELCRSFNRQYGTRFLSVMPTNLYGPNDSYDLQNSHVLPAFLRKFHLGKLACAGDWKAIEEDAKVFGPIPKSFWQNLGAIARFHGHEAPPGQCGETPLRPGPAIKLWGTGTPRREFLHSDDLAKGCVFLMERVEEVLGASENRAPIDLVNIGTGEDLALRDLAAEVCRVVGFGGSIEWDSSMPDGTPRKLLDVSRIKSLGWQPRIGLGEGLGRVYQSYCAMRG
jgi:GDP-L-fucose synthase